MIGRYYAMDRDKRWERIKKAYDLLTQGIGEYTSDPVTSLHQSYAKNITDEFIEPYPVSYTHLDVYKRQLPQVRENLRKKKVLK